MKPIAGIIIILVLIGGIFVPIDVPYTIESTAKALPVAQWVLHKNTDGTLVSTYHDYQTGLMRDYSSFQFDRGDVVNIKFSEGQVSEEFIEKGTRIASIQSNSLSERIAQLTTELVVEKALLSKEKTGQKSQIIEKQQEEIEMAKETLSYYFNNVKRSEALYNEGLISRVELEQAQNAYKEARIAVEVARKQLRVTKTGEKPEQIKLIKSRISALEDKIAFLEETEKKYEISTPLSGRLHFQSSEVGDKIMVDDTSGTVLLIPIKLKDRQFIHDSLSIDVDVVGEVIRIRPEKVILSDKVEILNMEQVVILKAIFKNNDLRIASGLPMKCSILVGDVTPKEYLNRSVKIEWK